MRSFAESVVLGSLCDYSRNNIDLRARHIKDNLTIHTCNDYDHSLEVIRDASIKAKRMPKIISKVYYNYPNYKHKRFRPILEQLRETKQRVRIEPESWQIQLCCKCNPYVFKTENGIRFIEEIRKSFNISKIYLENYPIYKLDFKLIEALNKFYKGGMTFGVLGYQNIKERVFSNIDLRNSKDFSIDIGYMGFLGIGNKKRKSSYNNRLMYNIPTKEIIQVNTAYLIKSLEQGVCKFGITSVSSHDQYDDLQEIYNKIVELDVNMILAKLIEFLLKDDYYKFEDYDQYSINYRNIKPGLKSFLFRIYNAMMRTQFNGKIGNGLMH